MSGLYNFTLEENKSINGNVFIFPKKRVTEKYGYWGKLTFLREKTDEKCWFYGRMSWVSFAHTTKASFTLWMCFPLTKEARQTDPHSWHLESGKTKLYKIGWIIFWKRIVALILYRLFDPYYLIQTIWSR